MSFDGDDKIIFPNDNRLNLTSQIEVMAWIYTNISTPTFYRNGRILQKGNIDNQYQLNYFNGQEIQFLITGVGQARIPGPSINTWHHVATTYDGSSIKTYLDDNLASPTSVSGSIPVSSDDLNIGYKTGGTESTDVFMEKSIKFIYIIVH